MSNPYVLAGVTAVLRARLESRLAEADVQAAIGPITVTSVPPDQVQSGGSEPNQLNVWLHHADPSAAWRNLDHPIRDGGGRRTRRPPLVLDLRYLITSFGTDTYAAEILLGHTLAEMHERPLLDLDSIDGVLHPPAPDPTIPAAVSDSGLENQPEPVRITPVAVGSEEMSRLWQALGAQYRATAAYEVGPVMIDPAELAATALPVLRPSAVPEPFAPISISDIVLAPPDEEPVVITAPIHGTDEILVRGTGVGNADRALVGTTEAVFSRRSTLGPVIDLGAVAGLRPGPNVVQLLQGALSQSNAALANVRPTVTATVAADTIDVTVDPPVGPDQRVILLLNQLDPAPGAEPLVTAVEAPPRNGAGPTDTSVATVSFDRSGVAAATWLYRLTVNGVSSVPTVGVDSRFDGPQVVIS